MNQQTESKLRDLVFQNPAYNKAELCRLIEVDRSNFWRWLRGRQKMSNEKLEKLKQVFLDLNKAIVRCNFSENH